MSTIKYKKNPRIKHRQQTYEKRFDELKKIHRFSFRKRKNFTPSQKAAITRLYRTHRETLKNLREDRGIFKVTTKAKVRGLKRARVDREGFKVTNKGVYVPGVRVEKIKAKKQKVQIQGKGKKIRIRVSLPSRIEKFFPYDGLDWSDFSAFVRYIIKRYKPDALYIQNENGRGKQRYDPIDFLSYADRDILPRIEKFKRYYGDDREPFTGVWVIWYKFR